MTKAEAKDELIMALRENEELRVRLGLHQGALRADDERLRAAEARVFGEQTWGCDAPMHMADTILELRAAIARVRALHQRFGIYEECGHNHSPDEEGVIDIHDVGLVCEEGFIQSVCQECDTDDGEVNEFTDEGEWPCATIKALEKP